MQYKAYAAFNTWEIIHKSKIPSKSLQNNAGSFDWQSISVKAPWHPTLQENQAVSEKLNFAGMWILRRVPTGPLSPAPFVEGACAQIGQAV